MNVNLWAHGRLFSHSLGDFVARFAYDGLGRLMSKETPTGPTVNGVTPVPQLKEFFYDGVRRIQEVITRDVAVLPAGGDNDELGDGEPGIIPAGTSFTWADRDYIYGPDDVDEFIAQIDRDGRAM